MPTRIAIDGIEVIVMDRDVDNLIERLQQEGVEVDDLEGSQTKEIHEPYDLIKFIEKAKEYSDTNPLDVLQFSETTFGAAAVCVKEFYLKHFGILIKSHSAKSTLMKTICVGLDVEQTWKVIQTWNKAKNLHDMDFLAKPDREALLESIKEMAAIFEQANLADVRTRLKSLTSVNFEDVKKEACKIGNNSYNFNCVAHEIEINLFLCICIVSS